MLFQEQKNKVEEMRRVLCSLELAEVLVTLSSEQNVTAACAQRTSTGSTALHSLAVLNCGAAKGEQVCHVILDGLLTHGADMKATMANGENAIHLAAAHGHCHLIQVRRRGARGKKQKIQKRIKNGERQKGRT
tara:strand:+ start:203 stop:601 length:399 start_codon:yes stop_codon:yes gene_type:complete